MDSASHLDDGEGAVENCPHKQRDEEDLQVAQHLGGGGPEKQLWDRQQQQQPGSSLGVNYRPGY